VRRAAALVVGAALVLGGCKSGGGGGGTTTTAASSTTTTTVATAAALCAAGAPQQVGTVTHSELPEVSGVVASRTHPDVLWVHNDSGDRARVFAVNRSGVTLRQYPIDGATAVD
jgi:hypothetical protein